MRSYLSVLSECLYMMLSVVAITLPVTQACHFGTLFISSPLPYLGNDPVFSIIPWQCFHGNFHHEYPVTARRHAICFIDVGSQVHHHLQCCHGCFC